MKTVIFTAILNKAMITIEKVNKYDIRGLRNDRKACGKYRFCARKREILADFDAYLKFKDYSSRYRR